MPRITDASDEAGIQLVLANTHERGRLVELTAKDGGDLRY